MAVLNKKLLVLIVTAGVDMMGMFLVLPLLPFYAVRFGGNGFVVAALAAAFNFAALIAAPYWGRFSDRHGRRPALMIALFASALGYLIFAFAGSITMLFLSRIVQGAGGGTVGVIQAYVADATDEKTRVRALGWLSAATNVGVMVGPIIGSFAVWLGKIQVPVGARSLDLGSHAPGVLAAAICLVNIYFVLHTLREARAVVPASRQPHRRDNARTVMLRIIGQPDAPASRLIFVYAIGLGAFYGAMSVIVLLLKDRYNFTETTIGPFFFYMGGISVLVRALLLGPAVDWLGEAKLSRVGTVLLALGLTLIPFAPTAFVFYCVSPLLNLGTAFTFPGVTSLLSRVIPSDERGVYMGAQQSFGGVARVFFPLGAGLLWDHSGHGAPFWVAATLVMATLLLGLDMESYTRTSPAPIPVTTVGPQEEVPVEVGK